MKLTFIGAVRTVTGSKHLLTTTNGKNILLDCGLFQGSGRDNEFTNRQLNFDPTSIDDVVLSHAHIDHSGNLPFLVAQGFEGKIYCTSATKALCEILLEDSAHIQENDVKFINKRRLSAGKKLIKPLYTKSDVQNCLKRFVTVPYRTEHTLNDEVSFNFTDAGHILGSAVVNLTLKDTHKTIKLCFTGDIGRPTDLIIKPPEIFPQADYIISESTYGNRLHDDNNLAEKKLLEIVTETCVINKGKLLIPAFSLGRTQELVYTIDRMQTHGLLPHIKVYVDSPLSIDATDIMREHTECFNEEIIQYMKTDPNPFGFANLTYIREVEDSKKLNQSSAPCIIISSSGMLEAGRIKHHLANNIGKKNSTLLIVGFVPPGSLGHQLIKGAREVRIFGEMYHVKMKVETIDSYSAHADYKEMLDFLSCQEISKVKKIFLVHGNEDVMYDYKIKLLEKGFTDVVIPELKQTVELV
jgi:metallo-beta-lactamase family protein